jgi:hypothetical protein
MSFSGSPYRVNVKFSGAIRPEAFEAAIGHTPRCPSFSKGYAPRGTDRPSRATVISTTFRWSRIRNSNDWVDPRPGGIVGERVVVLVDDLEAVEALDALKTGGLPATADLA